MWLIRNVPCAQLIELTIQAQNPAHQAMVEIQLDGLASL